MITLALAALAASSPAPATCPPMRVMTYNIRLDLESDGVNRWSNRRDQFIGQIGLMRPAILGLQEVVPGQRADLEKAFPNYSVLGTAREPGPSGESANLAFDRNVFSLKTSGTFWLSPTPNVPSKGWDAAYSRVATWAHLVRKSDGRKFLALNTHMDNEGQQARLEGARQITRWLAANRQPGEAVLVTGDMNTEPNTPPLQELTSAKLGLRDSRVVSRTPPVGPDGTWNDFNALPLPKDRMRIDFVLVDPKIEVERYGVLAWHFDDNRVASDHFPVVADLDACRR
ncbi:endonuclease/exonuclease/phosphatase family protein [Sphingomonas sp. SM33]|uniref:Endonuclease/exonuclease/phosphatase family protein n=1 Tax=Sphingomonas telluris TaxID=2907998 RepID=A0ABS9VLK2_9SPHN|nr:endonuclease/exonuclease/phosphatase family protein [Sphingomonas telluris]MCH8615841.1 endonuclease/exonuclease/phosphatase family protein [Sphingomonas telluris]